MRLGIMLKPVQHDENAHRIWCGRWSRWRIFAAKIRPGSTCRPQRNSAWRVCLPLQTALAAGPALQVFAHCPSHTLSSASVLVFESACVRDVHDVCACVLCCLPLCRCSLVRGVHAHVLVLACRSLSRLRCNLLARHGSHPMHLSGYLCTGARCVRTCLSLPLRLCAIQESNTTRRGTQWWQVCV